MSAGPRVLVIDDEESMRAGCSQTLEAESYRVQTASAGAEGLELAKKKSFDLVILDLRMPGMDGMEVLRKLREYDPASTIIVITGYATIETAVEAMKEGAYDFLPKPFTPETLLAVARRATDRKRLVMENICLKLELDGRMGPDGVVGGSAAMMKVAELVRKVAPTDSTVLVSGETGVGKELVALAIHRQSGRRGKPFVAVDCGALVETLFESELFGHVKGAFTGAIDTKFGKFELANGGTIFLDEIANIGAAAQAKLLRAIQEREITKVGGTQKVEVDVRIIAATNKDLSKEVREGRFREDLFYRLSVVPVEIPPLRERMGDIPLLAQYFLDRASEKRKLRVASISGGAMRLLESHGWPGNVRELENAIERTAVMAEGGEITPTDLFFLNPAQSASEEPDAGGRLAEAEKEEIQKALMKFGGQKAKAAEFLGIHRKTLREKMRKLGIDGGEE